MFLRVVRQSEEGQVSGLGLLCVGEGISVNHRVERFTEKVFYSS